MQSTALFLFAEDLKHKLQATTVNACAALHDAYFRTQSYQCAAKGNYGPRRLQHETSIPVCIHKQDYVCKDCETVRDTQKTTAMTVTSTKCMKLQENA